MKCLCRLLVCALLLGSTSAGEQPARTTLTVVPVYEGTALYVEAARTASPGDLGELFHQYVVTPYWGCCATGGETITLAQQAVAPPITDLSGLAQAVAGLKRADLRRDLQVAFDTVSAILPGPHTTVCVLAADPRRTFVRDSPHRVLGFTAGAGKVWLQITPEGAWRECLACVFAHEYHHSVWTPWHLALARPFDLIRHLVFEGRADSFARLAYPDYQAPWTDALTPAQEAAVWKTMQPHLQTTSFPVMRRFIFGGNGHIPRWAGYTVGFRLVQTFLKRHPDWPVERWTVLEAHELLQESGYAPH
jgi:uncharacterized protein YjaZ